MPEKKWINRKGVEVHPDNVPASEKLKDEMVREILETVEKQQALNQAFKADTLEKVDDYISLMREEYHLDPVKGKKGNIELTSFDGLQKVTITVQDTIEFDEKLSFAKEKIDEFLKEETKDSSANIQTLVLGAFKANSKGSVNVKSILELKGLEIESPLWDEAMHIIDESVKVAVSKSYIRFYKKEKLGDKFEHLSLDVSKI